MQPTPYLAIIPTLTASCAFARNIGMGQPTASSTERETPVDLDAAIVGKVPSWQRALARDIASANGELRQSELNLAIRRVIRCIAFLQMCEGRGIEPSGRLLAVAKSRHVHSQLLDLLRHAQSRLGRAMRQSIQGVSTGLPIGDRPLARIIRDLHNPGGSRGPRLLPVEILGRIYEQSLAKVVSVTPESGAVVATDPEVKKAGGVYYTPHYVVDYIVRQTVGKLLQNRPWQQAQLRIIDPACGSGCFLIGAYRYLLDWHRDRYLADDPQKHARLRKPRLYRDLVGNWRLTTGERMRILSNSIHGVDLDPEAVEVARLSLLLLALEGDGAETPAVGGLPENRLPLDVASNVKCGNALFAGVFKDGSGFDVVLGNPPYRRELGYKHLLDEIAETDFGRKYRSPRMDLWYYFVHRGLSLLKPGGVLSFIVNEYWTSGTGAEKLIATLRDDAHLDEVFSLGKQKVFPTTANGRHMIIRVVNRGDGGTTRVKLVRPESESSAEPFVAGDAKVLCFDKTREQLFSGGKVDLQPPADDLLSKLQRFSPLRELGIIRQGIAENPASINRRTNRKHGDCWQVGEGVFALSAEELESMSLPQSEAALLRPYHDLCDVARYFLADRPSLQLIYSTRETCPDVEAYPRLRQHLSRFRAIMENRRETRNGNNRWWHLHWPRDERLWRSSKILSLQMWRRPAFVPASEPAYVPFSINVFVPDADTKEHLNYICGLLNSRLIWKWFQHRAKRRGVGLEINGHVFGGVPIRRIEPSDNHDLAKHDRMVELVERMIVLQREKQIAQASHQKMASDWAAKRAECDRRIDQLVYELYNLTDEEISAVEESTTSE